MAPVVHRVSPPFLCDTQRHNAHEKAIVPASPATESHSASRPNEVIPLMTCGLLPTSTPSRNSNSQMSTVTRCGTTRSRRFLIRKPTAIPLSMMATILSITECKDNIFGRKLLVFGLLFLAFGFFVATCRQLFDVIFADPPYDLPRFGDIPKLVLDSPLVHDGTLFIMEHPREHDFSALPHFSQQRVYGKVNFTLFEINNTHDNNE